MTFRKGGRLPANHGIIHKGVRLKTVNSFRYLGVMFQTRGCMSRRKSRQHMSEIKSFNKLSMNAAMNVTYAIEVIWEHLKKKDLQVIERVKARYLKRAMNLSKFTPPAWCMCWPDNSGT